jgi:hypothetical protein
MADDLTKLTTAIRTGRRTRRVVAQNLGLSLTILAVLVPTALIGAIGLPVAVLAHELAVETFTRWPRTSARHPRTGSWRRAARGDRSRLSKSGEARPRLTAI